jgi:hypothetical protein
MFGPTTNKRVFNFSKVVEMIQGERQGLRFRVQSQIRGGLGGFNLNKAVEDGTQDQVCDFGLWTLDLGLELVVRS